MISTVSQLIRRAYVYSKVIAVEEDLTQSGATVTTSDSYAVEIQQGLQLLNELILTNNMAGNNWNLLTNQQYIVNANDDTLVLDGWAQILTIRFLLGNTWFVIREEDLNTYLEKALLPDSTGVPFIRFTQRTAGGYLLNFFQKANQNYTFDVWGYFQVTPFSGIQQTLDGFNDFYKTYYLYELAYRLQEFYQVPHTPYILNQRFVLKRELDKLKQTRIDRHQSYSSRVGRQGAMTIADWNLTQGVVG